MTRSPFVQSTIALMILLAGAVLVWRNSGKYKSVLTASGRKGGHYAMTDQKEFFAEMSEAYFGSNDFYPFVAGELKQAEPELFALLVEIWGPLTGHAKEKKHKAEIVTSTGRFK